MRQIKQATAVATADNFRGGYIQESGCATVAEYILLNDEGLGVFADWDDERMGCGMVEYKAWVRETYDFSPDDPSAGDWMDTIAYNER